MALEKSLRGKSKGKKSKKKASSKNRIRHTHIEHGEDGSHVIRHQFDQPDTEDEAPTPDSVHGVSDADGLLAHMQGQFGGQLPAPAAAGAGAPAAPPAGVQTGS